MSRLANTVSFDQFNKMLGNIQSLSNLTKVVSNLSQIGKNSSSITRTVLGRASSQVVSGIEAQSLEFDRQSDSLIEGTSTCRINNSVPGYSDILVSNPRRRSDISKITGSSNDGYLKEFICGSSPEAISGCLNTNTGRMPTLEAMGGLTTPEYSGNILDNLVNAGIQAQLTLLQLQNLVNSVNSAINNFEGGFLNNLLTVTNDVLESELNFITQGLLPENIFRRVMQSVLLGEKREASLIARNYILDQQRSGVDITIDIGRMEEEIYSLDPSVSNIVDTQSSSFKNIQPATSPVQQLNLNDYDVGNFDTLEGLTGSKFSFVNSYEELITDFRGTTRDITEVVVHWTAHFLNQGYVGSEEIEKIHVQNGWDTIGYHYVIKRDGSLNRGRPINREGAHARENGHNKFSIGVALVGGYNCNSGNPDYLNYISAESITGEQWKTLDQFLKAFYVVWPAGQVWGHNDTDPGNKVDPGIDMVQYVRNKFNRFNVSSSGVYPPLSPLELASKGNRIA